VVDAGDVILVDEAEAPGFAAILRSEFRAAQRSAVILPAESLMLARQAIVTGKDADLVADWLAGDATEPRRLPGDDDAPQKPPGGDTVLLRRIPY